VEASAHSRNRGAVVIHHCKAKADGQEKAREIVKMKHVSYRQRRIVRISLRTKPPGLWQRPKQVLTHGVEEAKILREQVVDGLKDELEVVHRTGSFDAPDLNNSF